MCLNYEHKINKKKYIYITIDNDKIDWYIYLQIKCASLKILECNIETNMHCVQFTWLLSPISFQVDVQIGCIFHGFKSQVEFHSFGNSKIYIHANIPNTCSTIYFYINMHKYYKSFFKVKSMTSIFKKSNKSYIKVSITYTWLGINVCILTFNNLKNSYPIQSLSKYQNASILTRTIHNNQKICQKAYMLLNDNIRIFLVTTKKIDIHCLLYD